MSSGTHTENKRDVDAVLNARDEARRTVRRELLDEADKTDKLLLAGLVLFVGLPLFAGAGWLIWLGSAERPWLMSFGTVLVVLVLVCWPLEAWLKRQDWFTRRAGSGRFKEAILKFPTLYLPILVIVGVNDLDHDKSIAANLREYFLTIVSCLVLLVIFEAAFDAVVRWWKKRSDRKGPRS